MKKQKNSPNTNFILDDEEQLIERALEDGEYIDTPDSEDTKKMLADAATRHIELNTSKPITIRINQLDLIKVKARANAKNIPYQTLLGSLIHQYAEEERELSL